jgi:hypothetical protein
MINKAVVDAIRNRRKQLVAQLPTLKRNETALLSAAEELRQISLKLGDSE